MSEPVDLSGKEGDDVSQGVRSLEETEQSEREGFAVTYVFGHGVLEGVEKALADMALSEARFAEGLPVTLHPPAA